MGGKPWRPEARGIPYLEVSPYRYAALEYADDLLPEEREWLTLRSKQAMFYDRLFFSNPNLAGLVPAGGRWTERWLKRLGNVGRRLWRRHAGGR